jgi:hypothetical protein
MNTCYRLGIGMLNTWLNFCYWAADHGIWIMIGAVALGFTTVAFAYVSTFFDYCHGRITGEEFNALCNPKQPYVKDGWGLGRFGFGLYQNGNKVD